MGSTEKVSMSLDGDALVLGRRAAALEGLSLSAYVSAVLRRHAWASERPQRSPEQQALADERLVEIDEAELWDGGEQQRAAG